MANEATIAQNRAADPGGSTWLAANAGSGKTRVLTDRVARLLLGGTDPQKILCLTFTKAAASEMQNRLFRRLGRWAMLEERALYGELRELGIEGAIGTDRLAEARRLFARAIETPGGLKIQTIHSFCAGLLRHFPLEARVSPDFKELDDRSAALIRRQKLEDMAAGDDVGAVAALAGLGSEEKLDTILAEICMSSELLARTSDDAELAAALGLKPGLTDEILMANVFLGGEEQLVSDLIAVLKASGGDDLKLSHKLADVTFGPPTMTTLRDLEDALLYKSGAKAFTAKIGDLPKKNTRTGPAAPLMPRLEALMLRVEAARPQRIALEAFRKTRALVRFAQPFLARYAAHKAARGLLDFDDLIARSAALLSDPGVAPWVLYRLDGGIDHILVDEAQDTSPGQWRVIERLAEEFTAGDGTRGEVRTIFVVGDRKQSIYSFQGADLQTFNDMQEAFGQRHRQAGLLFQDLELRHSFRSSPAILRVVDEVFAQGAADGLGGQPTHFAFRPDMPGRVDLWEALPKADKPERPHWSDPSDIAQERDAHVLLAEKIAGWIKTTVAAGTPVWTKGGQRPLHEGDFLILVRRRNELFDALIRACKAAGLRVAGADRLKLGAELAVKDITALLSFLALPEDDLSLAAALRSPLFDWSEDDLFRLAHGRPDGSPLWQALRGDMRRPETKDMLDDLRGAADFLRPYELIDRVLTRHGGRQRLLARLGPEAEDGVDALLSEALAYERTAVPSLTGFLVWMESGDVEVKRRLDGAGRAIRVMTVHGAKGLEAPVVILPDCAKPHGIDRGTIGRTEGGLPYWRMRKDDSPAPLAAAAEARRQAEEKERLRLLYVAMTRAESWLVVTAAGDVGKPGESWYRLVESALGRVGAVAAPNGGGGWEFGPGLRHAEGQWPAEGQTAGPSEGCISDLPPWVSVPPGAPQRPAAPLSPSDLGGAKALPGEGRRDEAAAKAHGTLVHRLLEVLPGLDPSTWQDVARSLADEGTDVALAEARRVIEAPELAGLFGANSLSEVELVAPLASLGERLAQGSIDRLIVGTDRVLAVDFKSNAVIPARPEEVPEGILRQMGAYGEMLAAIWPGRRIELAVVWTRTAVMMPIPLNIVRAAMQSATLP